MSEKPENNEKVEIKTIIWWGFIAVIFVGGFMLGPKLMGPSEPSEKASKLASASQDSFLLEHCKLLSKEAPENKDQFKMAARIITEDPKAFYQCKQDSDCVLESNACGGAVAIYKDLNACYARAARIYGTVIDCVAPEAEPEKTSPVCFKGLCKLK